MPADVTAADPPDQPIKGFQIICRECQGKDIQLDNTLGSSESGTWGDVTVRCRSCGNETRIIDT